MSVKITPKAKKQMAARKAKPMPPVKVVTEGNAFAPTPAPKTNPHPVTKVPTPAEIAAKPKPTPPTVHRAPQIAWEPGRKLSIDEQLAFLRNEIAPQYGRRLSWHMLAEFTDDEVRAVLRPGLTKGGCFGVCSHELQLKARAKAAKAAKSAKSETKVA